MSFGFDKNDTLFISTLHELHAVSLKGIEFSDQPIIDDLTKNIDVSNQKKANYFKDMEKANPKGFLNLQGLRIRMLFDEPQSFKSAPNGNSVIAICDGNGIARFNVITTKNFEPGSEGTPEIEMK